MSNSEIWIELALIVGAVLSSLLNVFLLLIRNNPKYTTPISFYCLFDGLVNQLFFLSLCFYWLPKYWYIIATVTNSLSVIIIAYSIQKLIFDVISLHFLRYSSFPHILLCLYCTASIYVVLGNVQSSIGLSGISYREPCGATKASKFEAFLIAVFCILLPLISAAIFFLCSYYFLRYGCETIIPNNAHNIVLGSIVLYFLLVSPYCLVIVNQNVNFSVKSENLNLSVIDPLNIVCTKTITLMIKFSFNVFYPLGVFFFLRYRNNLNPLFYSCMDKKVKIENSSEDTSELSRCPVVFVTTKGLFLRKLKGKSKESINNYNFLLCDRD